MNRQRALICGSLAYDTIMVFPDRFGRHILPDQVHMLSVSFQIGEMRREYGGCAGNIAYNLRGLDDSPVVMATLGDDGAPYRERLQQLGIATDGLRNVPGTFTAQAFIITDQDDNQITAFHPGAMNHSHENVASAVADIALGIVAPDGREGMLAHVREFANAGTPFIFDPGQGMPLFSGDELIEMIDAASYLAVNEYEGRMLAQRTGLTLEALAHRVKALIVTRGAEGSEIHVGGDCIKVPAARAAQLIDPTGCGDAYRAGLMHGIINEWEWPRTGHLAATLGALKIGARGGQNHAVSREIVATLAEQSFGDSLW